MFQEYDPYFCGGCIYSNQCLATAAWEGAGLSADSCVAINTVAATDSCPAVPDGTVCTFDLQPVTCDDCTYDNQCLADAAGATGCAATCPVPDGNVVCTREYSPVVCANGCFYSNACLAGAAGLASDQCSPVCPSIDIESASSAAGVACTREYAPVYCQGCEFDNECIAESVGFDVAVDCASITTTATAVATCPTISGEVVCTLDFNPVTCDGGCEYDNLCLANAAGATGCAGSCPVPDPNVACTSEWAPVACGGTRWCLYDNLCTALAAGQQEVDCVRDCPTNTNGAVACTTEVDPYFCGGCLYSNQCETQAAWVTSAGLPESSCVAINTLPFVAQACPKVPGDIACVLNYSPQTCDHDCRYDNECLAQAAGAAGCKDSCPLSDSNVLCTREYEPVICNGCVYNNNCLATAANFATTDCTPICPEIDAASVTSADGTPCTADYSPVYCQGCEFDNKCIAESAGFVVADDCASITTPTTRMTAEDTPVEDTSGGGASMKQQAVTTLVAAMMIMPYLV